MKTRFAPAATRLAAPFAALALLAAAAAPAQAGSLTVYSGMHCTAEGRFVRQHTGALLNDNTGGATHLFHCPVQRSNPLALAGTLSVTINAMRNGSAVQWDCALRAVDAQGNVFHSTSFTIPVWQNGPKQISVTSSPVNVAGAVLAHSISLRCNVPDVNGGQAGILSYVVTDLD